ncbi:MAG: DUF5020 family protein [Muribaculaceae bacterium]
MNKLLFTLIALMAAGTIAAQNIQLHYDFGRNIYSDEQPDRQKVTLTLEQFKADRLGSWFYFVDLDLKSEDMSCAYLEISREFNLKTGSPFAAHIEYDGGLNLGGSFQHVGLAGIAYNRHSDDFSKTWSLQLMYKQHFKNDFLSALSGFQLTGVWGIQFMNRKMTFSGFIDIWNGYIPKWNEHGKQKKGLVVLTEPQLWYNFSNVFSVGTEWEISNNFIYHNGTKTFYVNPTLAVKFNL